MKARFKKVILIRMITSFLTSIYTSLFATLMKQEFLSKHFFINWLSLIPRIYIVLLPFVLITAPFVEILVDKIFRNEIRNNTLTQ
jgi:hypothetical protein